MLRAGIDGKQTQSTTQNIKTSSSAMQSKPFTVIIIGGGPVGLTAAHALRLANIDFVLLEQRGSIVQDVGSSLILFVSSLRIIHQLGVLERVLPKGAELENKQKLTSDGIKIQQSNPSKFDKKFFGAGPHAFHRADLVEALLDSMPTRQRPNILTGKKVTDIIQTCEGVQVHCADNTVYDGSIVIGADGVNSLVRRTMRRIVLESDPFADWDPEQPYLSTYRCMWGSFPSSVPGRLYETYNKDQSTTLITGQDRDWVFLYEKLPEPTSQPVRYTGEEAETYAKKFSEFPVDANRKFKDILPHKMTLGMGNLEEGLVKHWSHGRLVLVGDACHKHTPNAGLGYNNGIQDVVVLCNSLHNAVASATDGIPNATSLQDAFYAYQNARYPKAAAHTTISASMIRQQTWATKFYYFLSRFIMTLGFVEYMIMAWVVPRDVKGYAVLQYAPAEEYYRGTIAWDHPFPQTDKERSTLSKSS